MRVVLFEDVGEVADGGFLDGEDKGVHVAAVMSWDFIAVLLVSDLRVDGVSPCDGMAGELLGYLAVTADDEETECFGYLVGCIICCCASFEEYVRGGEWVSCALLRLCWGRGFWLDVLSPTWLSRSSRYSPSFTPCLFHCLCLSLSIFPFVGVLLASSPLSSSTAALTFVVALSSLLYPAFIFPKRRYRIIAFGKRSAWTGVEV